MKNSYIEIIRQLDKFASSFSSICTIEEMVCAVEKILEETFFVDYTGLYLYDSSEKRLKLLMAKGFDQEEFHEASRTAMDRHPGLVFSTGKMIYISDTLLDEKQLTISSKRTFIVRSRLYLPVMNGNQIVGAFGIVSSKPDAFDEEDIATLSFICNMAGALYGNILNQSELRKMALIAKETENSAVITNKSGEIEWVNKAFSKITGYQQEEVQGKKPGDLLQGEETDPKTVALLSEAVKAGKSIEVDIINYSKSRRKYWLKLQIQPVFDSTGRLENYISIQKEITKEKEVELQLIKSEAKHAKMVANISDVIVIIDEQGINRYKSPNIEKLFGWKPEEVIGISAFANVHPEDQKYILNQFKILLINPNISRVMEFRYRCHNGSYKWVELTGINLFHDSDIQGILGNYHDITERKQAEESLKESEAKFNNIFNNSPALMLLLSVPERRISAVNDTFLQKTGLSRDEIIGKVIKDVPLLSFSDSQPKIAKELQKSERIIGLELELKAKNGNVIHGVLSRELMESYGRQYFLVLITDITDIKSTEKKLLDSEERFNLLAEHNRVVTWEVDKEGLYTFISDVCFPVLGFHPSEIIGKKHFYDLHTAAEREEFKTAAFEVFARNESFRNLENSAESKDGQVVWVSTNGIPILDSTGQLIGYRGTDTDITERREAEEDLNKLYRAVEQSPVMTCITDLSGNIQYVNPKTIELTGYTKEELTGQNPRIFSSGEKQKKEYENLWQTISAGKEWKGEFHNKKKNGELYWVMATLSPVFDQGGKITHYISVEEDITLRIEQYNAVQIANLRFKSLISSMQAGVMVEDEHRNVLLVNQYFCDLFSIPVPPDQLIGYSCAHAAEESKQLFTDPQTFIRDIDNTLILRQVITNHQLEMRNGTSFERDFIPLEDHDKKNQGILWIYRNITERKKAERDLLRQSEILSGTAKAMNYLLTIPDHYMAMQKALEAVGVATGVDRAYIFEATIDQTNGETFLNQLFEWTGKGVTPEIGNSGLQNMPFSQEYPRWYNLLSNGHTLSGLVKDFPDNERRFLEPQDILSLIVVPVFVNDVFWGTVGFDDCSKGIQWSANEASILTALAASIGGSISREIIGRELSNARLIAEKATKTKSDFLATMSHEIRTPMNGVIGMTSLLLQTQLTPDQHDYADTIKISGELLLNLINDILDFSKIESGKMVLEEHPFDLRMAIEDVLDLLASTISQKKLGLYFDVDPAIPQLIRGDLTRLRQILVNLTGNAIKFTTTGEIIIRVKQIERQSNEVLLEFSVKDTGVGIPDEKIERLFKPFSQVDTSITRKYGGTGLGLAICSKLVKLMNGTIRVKSEPNHGSEFLFTIKTSYTKSEAEYQDDNSSDKQNIKGKKLLIVDNHSTGVAILNSLFKNMGMICVVSNTANESLSILQNSKDIDIVVIDNELTDMDLNIFSYEIKKINQSVDLPLILMAHPTLAGDVLSYNDSFHVRINKPLKHSQLITYVTKLLAENKYTSIQKKIEPKQLQKINDLYPLNILVAEDNTINQKLILRLFEMLGYSINIAANGYEVIEALNRLKIDIIFMDIQMPEMDGLEATRQIIYNWGTQRPLIVAMTANALKNDKDICIAAGMDDYISKPLTINQVKAGIEKWARMIKVSTKG